VCACLPRITTTPFVAFDLLWVDDCFVIDGIRGRRRERLLTLDFGRALTVAP
jgi:hypothetical protein